MNIKKISTISIAATFAMNGFAQRPNIILIMSDDMGYSDLGCYGGEINTPHLDALAAKGVRFSQFYNAGRSCPTRASLMTGLHPHQTGIGHMTNDPENPVAFDVNLPGYRGFLNRNSVTIAEVLKEAGYTTLMTGKWHLGMHKKEQWPLQRGVDRFYGILAGAANFFKPTHPRGITLNNKEITISDPDYYTTNAFTDHAIDFIREAHTDSDRPFFLYLAYNAPHWPIQAPQEVVDKYKGKYMKGWSVLREERYQRMVDMGLIKPSGLFSPDDSKSWKSLDEDKKKEMDLRMAIYAAQVEQMDTNIGRLMNYLDSNNLTENTIIIFLNDNGACAEGGMLGGGPASQLETKEGYFLTYGQAWANASNTPLRRYKHWVHEGGISTPCIVSWPGGIPEKNQGGILGQFAYLPDIMATCVDLAETKYPRKYNGHEIHPLQGKSFTNQLRGKNKPIHNEPIFWEHEGNRAVRSGDYKLVMAWDNNKPEKWELYNVRNDRTEMIDLSKQMPDKVEEMKKMWYNWAKNSMVETDWSRIQELERAQRNKN
ncbi:arylsulfatase [Proteiniphilum sp. UBA5384]|uniref:arylsulfatase n=1 Tax=Proteiniphilum sp. UBA5384 TaxID=1947279 RepID=UPI0025CF286B|nr:arylsulfatase [Proteiniphilum sp. UBA5384]